ncbi:MAG: nicotinamidase/pyrazinamidase [Candidatus Omnitrophica bacterium CG11_big_fil_rev_8_21_14_0_20_45_26]|uniref:Nicotinamidase n=1 Tax=Candidatus Abzuiibacterium crystallinum TaxID=1974748 RepID=A0A2H0LQL5_9BACT|nr:MAG: nicotinamidase/pyrazinamidase [Candidatus Omnitrophica bacterium CG11_big_fil_rev_8_21_14_0_20_45_26]PIW63294.1 MAG: nicotinamidase/pyrazinamidase [Candidatus Omnitrophica bacterium CG12_big_fil_rev_8_21_14_0_65_45_16]
MSRFNKNAALLIVDLQNDFCPEGALAVPGGDEIVPIVNRLIPYFQNVIATQDWHPKGHLSFASQHRKKPGEVIELGGKEQVLWPDHCVQGTHGARFSPGLNSAAFQKIIQKGTDREVDSYSGFFDNHRQKKTPLDDYLKKKNIEALFIAGLATDYCVKFTALDAAELNYKTYVVTDACRGIELNPGDVNWALETMKDKKITLVTSQDVINKSQSLM